MIDIDKLRSLAEAATAGPWFVAPADADGTSDIDTGRIDAPPPARACEQHNAAFIAAANPAAVLELIKRIESKEDTLDVCENVIGTMPALIKEYRDRATGAEARAATLLADNRDLVQHCTSRREAAQMWMDRAKAAEADAARYQWLRSRDVDTIHQGGVFAGVTPDNLVINEDDLDCYIDAALARAEQEV